MELSEFRDDASDKLLHTREDSDGHVVVDDDNCDEETLDRLAREKEVRSSKASKAAGLCSEGDPLLGDFVDDVPKSNLSPPKGCRSCCGMLPSMHQCWLSVQRYWRCTSRDRGHSM